MITYLRKGYKCCAATERSKNGSEGDERGAPGAGAEREAHGVEHSGADIPTVDCGRHQNWWMCCAAHGEPMTQQTSGPCRGVRPHWRRSSGRTCNPVGTPC